MGTDYTMNASVINYLTVKYHVGDSTMTNLFYYLIYKLLIINNEKVTNYRKTSYDRYERMSLISGIK